MSTISQHESSKKPVWSLTGCLQAGCLTSTVTRRTCIRPWKRINCRWPTQLQPRRKRHKISARRANSRWWIRVTVGVSLRAVFRSRQHRFNNSSSLLAIHLIKIKALQTPAWTKSLNPLIHQLRLGMANSRLEDNQVMKIQHSKQFRYWTKISQVIAD